VRQCFGHRGGSCIDRILFCCAPFLERIWSAVSGAAKWDHVLLQDPGPVEGRSGSDADG